MRCKTAVRQRWKKIVMIAIGGLLISGLYNIAMIEATTTAPCAYSWYHPVFGVKFLLAMVVFMIASLLPGRTPLAQKMRLQMPLWLRVNLALILTIVLLSGVLRTAEKRPKTEATPVPTATDAEH